MSGDVIHGTALLDGGMSPPRPTAFTEAAKVELPLTLGAMYPCGNPELVAAVSEAGGLGIVQPISFSYVHAKSLAEGLARVRERTAKPMGFNAIIESSSKTYQRRMDQWIDEAILAGIRFFVTALGNPRDVAARVHQVGGVVWHDVTELRFAQKAKDSGVDGLIAVNDRAGGHAGTRPMRALLEELAPLGLPALAAGGISSPEDMLLALEMGYAGVQMGTRFIATPECNVHDDYRQAIVDAKERDITLTKRLSGVPVSIIRPDSWRVADSGPGEPGVLLSWMLRHPRFKHWARGYLSLTSLRRLKRSSTQGLGYKDVFQAGKSVGGIDAIEPAGVIVDRFREALEGG